MASEVRSAAAHMKDGMNILNNTQRFAQTDVGDPIFSVDKMAWRSKYTQDPEVSTRSEGVEVLWAAHYAMQLHRALGPVSTHQAVSFHAPGHKRLFFW